MPLGWQIVPFTVSEDRDFVKLDRSLKGAYGKVMLGGRLHVTAVGRAVSAQDCRPSNVKLDL